MGIIVHEDYEYNSDCDVKVSNFYINIKELIIEGEVKITYAYQIYSSQDARTNGKQPMGRLVKEVTLSDVLPNDLYAFVYDDLKKIYSSYVDA